MKIKVVTLISLLIYLHPLSLHASTSNDLAYNLSICSKVVKDQQRLVCFDKLALSKANVSVVVSVAHKPVIAAVPTKSKEAQQIENFSKQHVKKTPEEQGPDSITATISNAKQLLRGQWVIYLENGQKWQQTDSAKIKLKIGNGIRLKKGSMGAVYLFKDGSHRSIRVKRLK